MIVVKKDQSCPSTLDVERFIHVGNISDFEIVRIIDNLPDIVQKARSLTKSDSYGIELLKEGGDELKSISTTERDEGKPAGYELKFGKGVNCESMPTIHVYENENGFNVVRVGLLMV